MACCKCCCGNVDCAAGDQGKCCCGGSSGTCCQSGEYCCSGVCQASPCVCETPHSVTASIECAGLSITWIFDDPNNPRFVDGPAADGWYWLFGWPDGSFASTPQYSAEDCRLLDVNLVLDLRASFFDVRYREFWSLPGIDNTYGGAQSISLFIFGDTDPPSLPNPCGDTPTITVTQNPLP